MRTKKGDILMTLGVILCCIGGFVLLPTYIKLAYAVFGAGVGIVFATSSLHMSNEYYKKMKKRKK